MQRNHRNNILVTSCLKTPVDPFTKAPVALYERERTLPYATRAQMDNRDYEKELEYDYDSDGSEDDPQHHHHHHHPNHQHHHQHQHHASPRGDHEHHHGPPDKGTTNMTSTTTTTTKNPVLIKDYRVTGDHIDLREFYFSNEEYYRKLEQLKQAHLHTMAQLEGMYREKLQLKAPRPGEGPRTQQLQLGGISLMPPSACRLKKSHSAHELNRTSRVSDRSDHDEEDDDEDANQNDDEEGEEDENRPEKGLQRSPKERIRNMWQNFAVEDEPHRRHHRHHHHHHHPHHQDSQHLHPHHHASSPSLHVQTVEDPYQHSHDQQTQTQVKVQSHGHQGMVKKKSGKKKKKKVTATTPTDHGGDASDRCRPRVTMPEPFNMTLREASRKRRGVKTRSEVERENEELRRQLEELTECQHQFRASPVPAHVRQPLFEKLRQQQEDKRRRGKSGERQGQGGGAGAGDPSASPTQPFRFIERERLRREHREERLRQLAEHEADEERLKTKFQAKPVPRAVREVTAATERLKEEQLYRAIKAQMRARDLLHSSSMPPSMLARRLEDRKQKVEKEREEEERERTSHRPKIIGEVPDFDASYRRFQKQLEKSKREVRPLTACEPFHLRTAEIPSRRLLRSAMDGGGCEVDTTPRDYRWPFLSSPPAASPRSPRRAPSNPGGGSSHHRASSLSSLNSSLSGSQEMLSAKITDASRKRQEAIRKGLEERQKVEDEERNWQERQRERLKRLQKVISRRAQASDPHLSLAQIYPIKLQEFRKQDQQRRREYREEMKEIQERVKDRPLLLEQVTRNNAKLAAERRYAEALKACGLTEEFVREKALKCKQVKRSRSESPSLLSYQGDNTRPRVKDALLLSDSVSLDGTGHDYQDDYEEYDQDQEEEEEEEEDKGEDEGREDEKGRGDEWEKNGWREEEEENRTGEDDRSKSDEGSKSEPEPEKKDDDDDDDDGGGDDDDDNHLSNNEDEDDPDCHDNDREESDKGSDRGASDTSDRHGDREKDIQSQESS